MKLLTELHDPAAMMMKYPVLLKKCEDVNKPFPFHLTKQI